MIYNIFIYVCFFLFCFFVRTPKIIERLIRTKALYIMLYIKKYILYYVCIKNQFIKFDNTFTYIREKK